MNGTTNEPTAASASAAAIAAWASQSVPPQDVQQLTMLQAQTHRSLHDSNAELAAFNEFSAEEHARLVGRFAGHAQTLHSVHTQLLNVYRRTRALRARLLAAHPELAEAAAAADAAREAAIEQAREAPPERSSPSSSSAEALAVAGAGGVSDASAGLAQVRIADSSPVGVPEGAALLQPAEAAAPAVDVMDTAHAAPAEVIAAVAQAAAGAPPLERKTSPPATAASPAAAASSAPSVDEEEAQARAGGSLPSPADDAPAADDDDAAAHELPPLRAAPRGRILGRRARVGLLHGGCGNSAIFRRQLAKLLDRGLNAAAGRIEWIDLGGSLPSEEVRFDERGVANMATMRKAFGDDARQLYEHAVTLYDDRGRFHYARLDEAVRHLEAMLAAHAPIDALLGFSQGANMATVLSARACHARDGAPPPFRALVLLENDPPGWPQLNVPTLLSADHPLPTPALLVGGSLDSPKTDEVGRLYAAPVHARHADGHRPLPKDRARCATLVEEIYAFLEEHCPASADEDGEQE